MKIRSILLSTAALAVMASCAGVSDVTEITGTVANEEIPEVRVLIEGVVDTLVPVTDGKFALSLSTDPALAGRILAVDMGVTFIPDGTPLNVVIDNESKVTSASPRTSVQEKFNIYNEKENAMIEVYQNRQGEIFADTLLSQEEKNAIFEEYFNGFIGDYVKFHIKAAKSNKDNFISIVALNNLNGQIEDSEMNSIMLSLSPAIQENRHIRIMREALDARLRTAAGMKFTDFTVHNVTGLNDGNPPMPTFEEVSLSDHVGKGKYILVDFWAPWCEPCKRQIPSLKAVHDKYAGENFDILSIAVWENLPAQVTIETAAELGMDWLHINNAHSIPTEIYGIEGIPHLMLIGPDGTILERGFHGPKAIEDAVAKYLDK